MRQLPDRNLAMELVRVTEAAALAAGRWVGRGDKIAADGAAVDAMRLMIDSVSMDGVVVIGEGEKDEAPMLFNGERVGIGVGPATDVAVDPIDGTTLTSVGQPNALSVIAIRPPRLERRHVRLCQRRPRAVRSASMQLQRPVRVRDEDLALVVARAYEGDGALTRDDRDVGGER